MTIVFPTASRADAVLLVVSLAVNGFVVVFERRRGRALASTLLMADAAHTASDILVTILAMGSLALSHLGVMKADALLGMMVALIIAWSGYQILRESIPILVDARDLHGAHARLEGRETAAPSHVEKCPLGRNPNHNS